jgi:WD40 repeat protein
MEPVKLLEGHRGPVYALASAGAQGSVISAGSDGVVALWDLGGGNDARAITRLDEAVFSLLLLPGPGLLVVGTEGGRIHVVDLQNGRERHCFQVHRRGVFDLVSIGPSRFAAAGGDGTLSIWEVDADAHCSLWRQLPLGEGKLRGLCHLQQQGWLAVACGEGPIRLLETGLFNEVHTLEGHDRGALCVALHPTKPALLSGGKDGHLRGWSINSTPREVLASAAHRSALYRIGARADGSLLATVGRDKAVKVWDGRDLGPIARHEGRAAGHTHSVNGLVWMDEHLVTAGDDRVLRVFKPAAQKG